MAVEIEVSTPVVAAVGANLFNQLQGKLLGFSRESYDGLLPGETAEHCQLLIEGMVVACRQHGAHVAFVDVVPHEQFSQSKALDSDDDNSSEEQNGRRQEEIHSLQLIMLSRSFNVPLKELDVPDEQGTNIPNERPNLGDVLEAPPIPRWLKNVSLKDAAALSTPRTIVRVLGHPSITTGGQVSLTVRRIQILKVFPDLGTFHRVFRLVDLGRIPEVCLVQLLGVSVEEATRLRRLPERKLWRELRRVVRKSLGLSVEQHKPPSRTPAELELLNSCGFLQDAFPISPEPEESKHLLQQNEFLLNLANPLRHLPSAGERDRSRLFYAVHKKKPQILWMLQHISRCLQQCSGGNVSDLSNRDRCVDTADDRRNSCPEISCSSSDATNEVPSVFFSTKEHFDSLSSPLPPWCLRPTVVGLPPLHPRSSIANAEPNIVGQRIRETLPVLNTNSTCSSLRTPALPRRRSKSVDTPRAVPPQWTRIIDVGGGRGDLALAIAENIPRCRVLVVDCNDASIRAGHRRALMTGLADRIQFVKADFRAFDSKRCIADMVVALHACGGLTDAVISYVARQQVPFLICTCCFGKHRDLANSTENTLQAALSRARAQSGDVAGTAEPGPQADPAGLRETHKRLCPTTNDTIIEACHIPTHDVVSLSEREHYGTASPVYTIGSSAAGQGFPGLEAFSKAVANLDVAVQSASASNVARRRRKQKKLQNRKPLDCEGDAPVASESLSGSLEEHCPALIASRDVATQDSPSARAEQLPTGKGILNGLCRLAESCDPDTSTTAMHAVNALRLCRVADAAAAVERRVSPSSPRTRIQRESYHFLPGVCSGFLPLFTSDTQMLSVDILTFPKSFSAKNQVLRGVPVFMSQKVFDN
eukprot:GHVT01042873.1.p1 GENE.GHVT01042873.1~~GHVT01042873.1.p1  ORF type:complete len:875 (-),score=60.13 GHVT01042873.1:638-3262(-)